MITIIKSPENCNKSFNIKDGQVIKTPPTYAKTRLAETIVINDLNHLKCIIQHVNGLKDAIIMLGYIKGWTNYSIISQKSLQSLTNRENVTGVYKVGEVAYAARLKTTFTQSRFLVIDRDEVEGMPTELLCKDHNEWWKKLTTAYPMLEGCGHIISNSNSSRVFYNGKQLYKNNTHVYIECKNSEDVERFGRCMLIHAFNRNVGFMKKVSGGGFRPWSIFDPTTFSREREIYEGSPISLHSDLEIKKGQVELIEGFVLDTALLVTPSLELQQNIGMVLYNNKNGNSMIKNTSSLTLDTMIDIKDLGVMSLRQYCKSHNGINVRCQSPFRPDSNSMAAYIHFTTDNQPFLHDVGTATNYYLSLNVDDIFEVLPPPDQGIQNEQEPNNKPLDSSKLNSSDFNAAVTPIVTIGPIDTKTATESGIGLIPPDTIFSKAIERLDALSIDRPAQLLAAQKLIAYLDDDPIIRIEQEGDLRRIMGWTKQDLTKIIKKKSTIKDTDENWLLNNIVLINEGVGGYYNLHLKCYQTKATLNDSYAHLSLNDTPASIIINQSKDKFIAQGIGWQPADNPFFQYSNKTFVNSYEPISIIPKYCDVSRWIELVNYICGEYAHHFISHQAFTLQKPLTKIRWQILIYGSPRIGKTLILEPLIEILGNACGDISNDMFAAGWDDIYRGNKALVFNEVMQNDKRAFNSLKSKLSDSNVEKLNLKGGKIITQQNYYSMYMCTNYPDALRFDIEQSKLLVIESPTEKWQQEKYEQLGILFHNPEFLQGVYHYLLNYDVSKFSHSILPVTSQATQNMAKASKPDYELTLVEWINNELYCFLKQAFTFKQLKDLLVEHNIRCSNKNINRILVEKGFKKVIWKKSGIGRGVYWTNNEIFKTDSLAFLKCNDEILKMSLISS